MLQTKTLAITLAALAAGIFGSAYMAAAYTKRKHSQLNRTKYLSK